MNQFNSSSQRKISIGFITLGILVAVALMQAGQNWQFIAWHLFGNDFLSHIPVGLISLLYLVLGLFTGFSLSYALDKSKINQQKIEQWQAQDHKLMTGLISDREKQLEAKIATLEAALATALQRK